MNKFMGNKWKKKTMANDLKIMAIMRGTGHTHKEIADKLGLSQQAISNRFQKLKERAKENGVDNTLSEILLSGCEYENMQLIGLVLMKLQKDTEWWSNHYQTNAHWLIQRLWQLCNTESEEEIVNIKSIVMASLPHFAESYGFDLEKYVKYEKGEEND
tara:strand:- start:444 stop:917 length:474 start_codon:yes stop_codon:yes gene_type:complete